MGFLQWFTERSDEDENEIVLSKRTQDSLEKKGNSVDAAVVNQMLRDSIHQKGGSSDAQRNCSVAVSEELFDMPPKEVYKTTGGKAYDRSTLPPEVQAAWMGAEVVATHTITQTDIYSSEQGEIDYTLEQTARVSVKGFRRWLKW